MTFAAMIPYQRWPKIKTVKTGTDGTFPRFTLSALIASSKNAETFRLSGFPPAQLSDILDPGKVTRLDEDCQIERGAIGPDSNAIPEPASLPLERAEYLQI